MKIDKNFEGLKRIENGDYVIEGDLVSEDSIEIELDDRLVVTREIVAKTYIKSRGDIEAGDYIEAGGSIKAGGYIEAGGSIKAGGGIEAGGDITSGWSIEAGGGIEARGDITSEWSIEASWGIEAGGDITAETFIHTKKRIFAGTSVYCTSEDCEKTIRCAELRGGDICYGDLVIVSPEGDGSNV